MKTKRLQTKKRQPSISFANTSNKLYIGIDNGVTGTIGCIFNNQTWLFTPPTKSEQNYTKAKANITRIIRAELLFKLQSIIEECSAYDKHDKITRPSIMCLIERPMINPGRFRASISGIRALETTLNVVEEIGMPYQYEDSKAWQKELLPRGVKGSAALKAASETIGSRLFPQHTKLIQKHGDADGILLAEYCRRKF